ncbi:MAG: peptidoglycan editing factor PgeF [Leptolyngbyaceae cyanobacterium bins.59]|nr:peptidoglycan editing factor PgeF [Leptolyngbyaceae cyanobacterium bins.59]
MADRIEAKVYINRMHTWHWHTWEGLPYLTCSLLDPWPHGFFTNHFWPQNPLDLTPVLHPIAPFYRTRQVHGNVVLTPTEIGASAATLAFEDLPSADGLLTDQADQAVWVCTADCTPVLIGDAVTGQVAAVHAGWRGTATKIVLQAIARLQDQGSQLSNLRVALGPAIAGEVYQVGKNVAMEVGATIAQPNASENPETVLEALYQLPQPPILPDPHPERVRLDVRRVIALQLDRLGLQPEQITIAPHCTFQQPDYFFSYRRTQQKQVQWSGIVSRNAGF